MNRGTRRQMALSRRSWHADVDADFVEEVNTTAIDGAVKLLASKVPEAFIPDRETVYLYKDETDTTLARKVAATTDPYVLSFGLAAGGTSMKVDGTRDLITHIEVVSPDNGTTIYTRVCREFWLQSGGAYDGHYLVSIDRPWRNGTDTDMAFRLFRPFFYLRDNTTELIDGRVFDSSREPLYTLPAGYARRIGMEDYRGTVSGRPESFARWEHKQLAAPNRAPTAALGNLAWLGPMPPGKRKYRYTYVWGKRDFELAAPSGTYDPVWESAPSPESGSITVPDMTQRVELSNLTNIDFMLGFGTSGTVRNTHSGLRKRIYVAISSVLPGAGTTQEIEYPDIYFLLDEVDGSTTAYIDDGSKIPDYHRRLPESRGYYAYSTVPHHDADYQLDLRVYRRPLALLSDSDAPQIHPEFDDMLDDLILSRLCEIDKSPVDAKMYMASFEARLLEYRSKEANPADFIPPRAWGFSHADVSFDPSRYTPYRDA